LSQFKNVNVVQYNVSNWAAAKKFYSDVLEWPVAFDSDEAGWCEWGKPNETHLSINRWNADWGPQPTNGALAVLTVDDASILTRKGMEPGPCEARPWLHPFPCFASN
jgi:catechol-2,3-dioxygenase